MNNARTILVAIIKPVREDCQGVRLALNFCPVRCAGCCLSGWKKALLPSVTCATAWTLCCRYLICPFHLVALSTDSPPCLETGILVQICSPVMIKEASLLQACWHWMGLSCCIQWILPFLYQFCKRKVHWEDVLFFHGNNESHGNNELRLQIYRICQRKMCIF